MCICNFVLSLCPIYSHHLEIFYLNLMAVVPSAVPDKVLELAKKAQTRTPRNIQYCSDFWHYYHKN